MSAEARETALRAIETHPDLPVLILGGGINGIGLFRELALQGVDCLLVDKADFVAGASSKASRMIHGGLRYLENREFRLVRESLLERNLLLQNAPHYVAPLRVTMPLFSWLRGLVRSALVFLGLPVSPGGRGAVIVKVGLLFYDFVTRRNRKTPRHRFTSKAEALRTTPGLNPAIVAAATYWDARITQAERLCIELIRDAREANPACHALNHIRSERAEYNTVTLQDEVTGRRVCVRPRVVVNATGAWIDLTNACLGLKTRFIGGTKGSHLVVDCKPLHDALGDRMVYYDHQDGRVCIVFPFADKVIMGSTDIRVDDPETARCDDDEIDYMLTTLRGIFPDVNVLRKDIVFRFCGVRPLPRTPDDITGRITRGHGIQTIEPNERRPFPVYCLIGGKWTTFRAFAEQTADRILARLAVPRRCSTEHIPIGGGRGFPASKQERDRWIERFAAQHGVTSDRAATLLERYGTAAADYAANETPLQSLAGYSVGEIERIAATEYVEHLTDLVCRRSTIAILGQAREGALQELAEVVARVLSWDQARKQEEISQALAEVVEPPSVKQ